MVDKDDEVFDLVDDDDRVIGSERRAVVHAKGLLHRAVYCWVFNKQGQLLLQQRSLLKKIGASQWDLSVAEHLEPGEGYREGAARGLQEELGITTPAGALSGPLAATHRRELHDAAAGYHDVELVQSFRLGGYEGAVSFDDGEVVATRWVGLAALEDEVAEAPERFTAWLREEGASLRWLRPPETRVQQQQDV